MIERPGALHFYDGHRVVTLAGDDSLVAALAQIAAAPIDPADLERLARLAGTDRLTAGQLAELLASVAVIETDPDSVDPRAEQTGPEVRSAASFSRATVGTSVGTAEARRRLAGTTVHVLGPDPAGVAEYVRQFQASGLAAVATDWHHLRTRVRGDPMSGELVVCDATLAMQVNELSLHRGFAWYPLGRYDGALLRIGPLVVPGQTACYACLRSRLSANVDYASVYLDVVADAPAAPAPAALDAWATSVAILSIIRWVAGADPTVPGRVHTLVPGEPGIRSATVYRVPRCRVCAAPDYVAATAPWEDTDAG